MNHQLLLSIVIPTKNDYQEFKDTLISIKNNCPSNVQIVIVDGGEKDRTFDIINQFFSTDHESLTYIRDMAKGVFPAQNIGITESIGEWIMILNSGDLLTPFGKEVLTNNYLSQFKNQDILVFSQETYSEFNEKYKFLPTNNSVWPHQSILARKKIYIIYGLYREDIPTCSEQLFFAQVRKKVNFQIIDLPITLYKLGGLSSKINLKISKDIYKVKRELGENIPKAISQAYLFPYLRKSSEFIFGYKITNRLKIMVFKYYKSM